MLNILSLFDGISCGRIALERANIPVRNYYASEIDKKAIKVSKNNYEDIIQLGDICNLDTSKLPYIHLLIGGSPCQSFSNAGDRSGLLEKALFNWYCYKCCFPRVEAEDCTLQVFNCAFKEKNAEAFGGNPNYNKDGHNDNEIIVFKYCTNPRIDKMIFKLIDEGHKLEMRMMEHLPKRVYADIAEEEWQEIIKSNWIIDFRKLRKLMTKRCQAVLKQVITNNALK